MTWVECMSDVSIPGTILTEIHIELADLSIVLVVIVHVLWNSCTKACHCSGNHPYHS